MTIIKKGTKVWLIQNASDTTGLYQITQCVVDSCGAVQMHLRETTGEMTKHRFYMSHLNQIYDGQYAHAGVHVFAVGTVDATAKALEFSAQLIASKQVWLTRIVNRDPTLPTGYQSDNQQYLAAIRKDLEQLKTQQPRVVDLTGLTLQEKVAAYKAVQS